LEVLILGSGSFIPTEDRSSPSVLIKTEKTYLLLDIGPGTVRQIKKAGLSCISIKHILISHFHPDHTADLIHFMFFMKNIGSEFQSPFTVHGPPGIRNFIRGIQRAYGNSLNLPAEILRIDEMGKKARRDFDDVTVISFPVKHSPESVGYRIEASGKRIVYSGDTGFCEEIIEASKDVDLLILECSFPEEYLRKYKIDTHLSPDSAGRIAGSANVKNLVLTHLYPECLKTDIIGSCKRHYKGNVIIAKDFLRIKI